MHLGLLHEQKEPKHLGHHLLPPSCIHRKLDVDCLALLVFFGFREVGIGGIKKKTKRIAMLAL